jgi:class 3 adenylate cyclase
VPVHSVERKLAAIFAADIAGYSRLMARDEEGTLAPLKAIRPELSGPKIAARNGGIVKTTGDGLLVEFASIVDAMRFVIAWQQDMAERPQLADTRIDFHIGDRVNLTSKQQN